MLTVQVELLTGRYVATRFNDRSRVEWPPHPSRLFSAAVAAWADADEPDHDERFALLWWEALGSPGIGCSWGDGECGERAPVTHFVPVNDTQVVSRDMSASYARLWSAVENAEHAAEDGNVSSQKAEKAEHALVRLRVKAVEDSMRAESSGAAPATALGILPEGRFRQAKQYPTAVPSDDLVKYQWPEADADVARVTTLDALLSRIARLGHSSSLVSVSVIDGAGEPNLVPDERGQIGLRVASPGQLAALEVAFAGHAGTEPRILPALIASYREQGPVSREVPAPVFDRDWLLLELLERHNVTVRDTLPLARAIRGALMRHGPQEVPEVVSGHAPGPIGAPTSATDRPHLAVVPLPFAAHPHADGLVRAVALVLPRQLDIVERRQVEDALERWVEGGGGLLQLGHRGVVRVGRLAADDAPRSARPGWWCDAAQRWASVTPIALDRNPGNLADRDPSRCTAAEQAAEAIVATSCTNIGLPPPDAVAIHTDPRVTGSAPLRSFPGYAVQGGRLRRVLVHAELTFAEEVAGPLLLGAGRFLGYGLCVPIEQGKAPKSD